MSDLATLTAQLVPHRLRLSSVTQRQPKDALPDHIRSIALVSPDEPAFWTTFTASPEYSDDQPDPLDRWSARIIGDIAEALDAIPLFPFGGPPHHPFYSFALRAGRAHVSPVQFLADHTMGLFASYRGALALPFAIDLPATDSACTPCAQPCRTACPAQALTDQGYDVPRCHALLDSQDGTDCLTKGCRVRRACPVGAHLRLPEQSAYHMGVFHR